MYKTRSSTVGLRKKAVKEICIYIYTVHLQN